MMKNMITRLKSGVFGCLLMALAAPSMGTWSASLVADVGLEQAIRLVKAEYTGSRVLSAVSHQMNGKKIYHIKVLASGRVKTIRLDAETGQTIRKSRSSNAYPNNRR